MGEAVVQFVEDLFADEKNYGISIYCDDIRPTPDPMLFATLEEAARTLLKKLMLTARNLYFQEKCAPRDRCKFIILTVDDALGGADGGTWFTDQAKSLSVKELLKKFHEHPSVNLCCQCFVDGKYVNTIHGALQGKKEIKKFTATDPGMKQLQKAFGSGIRIRRINP